jgi:hypothetical protein
MLMAVILVPVYKDLVKRGMSNGIIVYLLLNEIPGHNNRTVIKENLI